MTQGNYTYGLLLKADETAKAYKIKAYPTYVIIGKDGEIAKIEMGYDEAAFRGMREAIDALLEGKPVPKAPAGKEGSDRDLQPGLVRPGNDGDAKK